MPLYFIETIVEASHNPDRIGTNFHDAEAAMKAALWAILDIVHDEAETRAEMDVTVIVKDANGQSVFSATLQAERRLHSEIRAPMPVPAKYLHQNIILSRNGSGMSLPRARSPYD